MDYLLMYTNVYFIDENTCTERNAHPVTAATGYFQSNKSVFDFRTSCYIYQQHFPITGEHGIKVVLSMPYSIKKQIPRFRYAETDLIRADTLREHMEENLPCINLTVPLEGIPSGAFATVQIFFEKIKNVTYISRITFTVDEETVGVMLKMYENVMNQ